MVTHVQVRVKDDSQEASWLSWMDVGATKDKRNGVLASFILRDLDENQDLTSQIEEER